MVPRGDFGLTGRSLGGGLLSSSMAQAERRSKRGGNVDGSLTPADIGEGRRLVSVADAKDVPIDVKCC